jgi:hypothetical protein
MSWMDLDRALARDAHADVVHRDAEAVAPRLGDSLTGSPHR